MIIKLLTLGILVSSLFAQLSGTEAMGVVVVGLGDSGTNSLRQAIIGSPSGSTITFAPSLSGGTISLTGGQLLLSKSITINASTLTNGITINGLKTSRIFQVVTGATVTLNSLVLTNGNGSGSDGGAIYNQGNLTLIKCTVSGNAVTNDAAQFGGGGVCNLGDLTSLYCTFSGNLVSSSPASLIGFNGFSGYGGGGAIYNGSASLLVLQQCTLALNSLTNFSAGSTGLSGGAILNDAGIAHLTQCTVASNTVIDTPAFYGNPEWGGIDNYGTLTLTNTIDAANSGEGIAPADLDGTFTGVNNFISGNPQLGALANHGGSTLTMLPFSASPVIDAGNDSVTNLFATDQRGSPRFLGAHVDIGSVEVQSPVILTMSPTASTLFAGQSLANSTLNGGVVVNLSGTVVPGTFSFTSPLTIPAVGTTNEPVVFLPTDTNSYTAFAFTVSVTVTQVIPLLITAPTASTLTNGQPLSASTLTNGYMLDPNTGYQVTGIFAFAIPALMPGPGTAYQAVIFFPANSYAYTTVTTTVPVTVLAPATVVTTANDDNSPGSLRQIVLNALPGGTITFASYLSGATITLTNGELVLNQNLTIDGSSLANGISISGHHSSRIFTITNASVVLNSLVITNGYATTYDAAGVSGGGIYNIGTLTMNDCTLVGNTATVGAGGGIGDRGALVLNECTLTGNYAPGGGGIGLHYFGTATSARLNQCTLTGNASNQAPPDTAGNDLWFYVVAVTNINSIVSDVFNNQGGLTLSGVNLIQTYAEYNNPSPVNPAPVTNAPALEPLGNYGGPTPTMPPLPGSPAIDGCASGTSFTTDQRGFPRIVGPDADLGAAEAQPAEALATVIYDDALQNDWQDWGFGSTRNFANASPVHAGSDSISVLITNGYGGAQFHQTDFDDSAYGSISFWINGGATGGQNLQLYGVAGGNIQTPRYALNPLPPNTWVQYTVPLSALGVADATNFDAFAIQDAAGIGEPVFYLDDLRLNYVFPAQVVFQVDMSVEAQRGLFNPPADYVAISGDFNGWSTTRRLTNNVAAANSNLYSGTVTITNSTGFTNYYKFVVDGGQNLGFEQPISTSGGNRSFVFAPTNDTQTLPAVYFADLGPANLIASNTLVTFTVDMTGAVGTDLHAFVPGKDSVYLNGNFLGWWASGSPPTADLLTNIPGTGLYQITLPLAQGTPRILYYNYSINGVADEAAYQHNHVRYVAGSGNVILPADIFGQTLIQPLITWPTPAPVAYGTALNSNQLNAAANTPGTFDYSPPIGTVLSAGTNTLTTIFTPSDTVDYYSATSSASLVVSPAPLSVTANNFTRAFGQPNPAFAGSIVGLLNGDAITANFSCSAGLTSLPGNYPITVTLLDPGLKLGNYLVTTNSGTLTVTSGAQVLGYDDASAYTSPDGILGPPPAGTEAWSTGQNFGFGFQPWIIQTNGPANQGAFIGAGGGIASTNAGAWGLYAYGQPLTNTVVAYRGFSNSLPTGLSLSLKWLSHWIGTNAYDYAGFNLRSGNASSSTGDLTTGERMAFFYRGAGTSANPMDDVIIRDGSGENDAPAPGVNFARLQAGIAVEFTLLSSNTYRLIIRDAATSNTIAEYDNRALEGNGTIDSLALFDNQTDPQGTNGDGNQMFNSLVLATPTIPLSPSVTVTPGSLAVTPGGTATFSANATGTPPLVYQWLFNGNVLANANSGSLTLNHVQVGNGGQYQAVVSSPYGSITSSPSLLSLVTPTTILIPPANAQVTVGGSAAFSVVALSSGPLTYQWLFAGAAIPGATNVSYQVVNAQLISAGNYTVQIRNSAGAVATASAGLLVVPPPAPTVKMLSYTIHLQAGTNFIANQLNQGGNTLREIMPVVPDGTVVAKFDNASQTWSSATFNAALGAWVPSSIVLRPGEGAELISPVGFNLTFTGTANVPALPLNIPDGQAWLLSRQTNDVGTYENIVGSAPAPGAVIYQWNPTNGSYTAYTYSANGWPGGTEPTAAVGESFWIAPAGGAPVAIPTGPTITLQPANFAAVQGGSATFNVAATGSAPLLYQWQLDGNAIADATNQSYTITHVQPADAGAYSVAIANSIGITNSDVVALSILNSGSLPVADNFTNAGSLPNNTSGLGTAANFGATTESGEPGPDTTPFGASVWVKWQVPASGIASLTTAGSSFDTVLGVFSGTGLANLQLVANDDDSGPNLTSALTFNAVGGTTYYIQISGFNGAQGNILLAWNLMATTAQTPVIVVPPQNQTQTNTGPVTLSVIATNTDPVVAYQWFLNNTPLAKATNSVYQISSLTANQVGLYTVSITNSDTQLGVVSAPVSVEIFNPGAGQPGNFENVHPQDKFINATLLTPHDPNVPNDPSFAGGYTGTQIYSSVGSSADQGEPDHCGYAPCHSVWYAYLPSTTGVLTLTTTNDFDAILEVYGGSGASFSSLIPLACSAHHGLKGESISMAVEPNTYYWVVVDGVNCANGNFALNYSLSSPPVFSALPVGQTLTLGSSITLSASTVGTPPFTYQWLFQGNNIPMATNSSFTIPNFQWPNQGNYSVMTMSPAGTNVSAQAALYLSSPPRFVSFGVISGAVSAQFVGAPGTNYVFEASSNMLNWLPLTTNSSAIGIFNFYDQVVPAALPNRFYRAVSQ